MMNALLFRKLRNEDIAEFVEMRKLQLLEEGALPTTDLTEPLRDYFRHALEKDRFVSWIALDDGKIVATSGMSFSRRPPYYSNPTGFVGTLSCMHTCHTGERGSPANCSMPSSRRPSSAIVEK
ncbi:hypothetical protein [Sporolactobacillus terrae]|uniref:hypothetical protein n=1 Tax=Sporolactobacillus terrae TaxID=269673 RepID=UPI0019D42269|nr:hypothetical protein [Sporolactobacillus terrae]UAK15495.1 hypothetical protein K7399_10565 [Sporolactobacillus terrae]